MTSKKSLDNKIATGRLLTVKVRLTNAQIKAMRATPVTLVPAVANKTIQFVCATLKLVYGSNVFTESADNMAIKYTDGSGVQVSQDIEATGFIDQSADTVTSSVAKIDAIVTDAGSKGKALVLHNTGDGEYGGNAGADNKMIVTVSYIVHDLAK
jgi:hypothetical protein